MARVSLQNVCKTYSGNVNAVRNFDLDVADQELVAIVGPSGCGKSTLLRMIAGIEEVSDGEIWIDGTSMRNVPAKDRNISMVFQNYALFPHMSVFENIAFGLRARKVPQKEIERRVAEVASALGINHLLQRKPKALSGGEKQRVAMGRAMVRTPSVFLMDEPLSNLDAQMRVKMRTELSLLHRRLQSTFIYVTHDQTEAMTLGDRIVVMKDGILQQVGTPKEIYQFPQNIFVAGFVGSPQMNFMERTIGGAPRILGIRPEDVLLCGENDIGAKSATVELAEMLGQETLLHIEIEGEKLVARVSAECALTQGEKTYVRYVESKIHVFDQVTEKRCPLGFRGAEESIKSKN